MKKLARHLSISALGLMLGGCFGNHFQVDPISTHRLPIGGADRNYYAEITDGDGDQRSIAQFSGKRIRVIDYNSEAFQSVLKGALSPSERNDLVFMLRGNSDEICDLHKAKILANSASINVGLGGLTSLLAGLASVAGTVQAPYLAAGAALTNSTRSLINEEVYAKSVGSLIVRAIEKARDDLWIGIEQKLKTPITEYSQYQAVSDVEAYHQRCSFYVGITKIAEALENQKPSENVIMSKLALIEAQADKVSHDISEISAASTGGQDYRMKALQNQLLQLDNQKQMLRLNILDAAPGSGATPGVISRDKAKEPGSE